MDGTGGLTDHEPLAAEDNYPVGAPSANLIDLARGAAGNGSHGAFGSVISEAAIESVRTGRPVRL